MQLPRTGRQPPRTDRQPPRTDRLPPIEGRRWGPAANLTNRRRNSNYQDPYRDRSNSSSSSGFRGLSGPRRNNSGSYRGEQRGSYHRSGGNIGRGNRNGYPPRVDHDGWTLVQRRRPR